MPARTVLDMAKSRRRKGKAPNRTATRKPGRPAGAPGRHYYGLRVDEDVVVKAAANSSPELLPITLPAFLWLYHIGAAVGNRCVDAAFTLRYAYGELGVPAELLPVDLVVNNAADGRAVMHGQPYPRWENNGFTGHCILHLPDSQRFVDVTAEQFPQIGRLQMGPVVGRISSANQPIDLRGPIPPGTHFAVQRKHLILLYTVSEEEYSSVILDHPPIRDAQPAYRRAGINLAAHALALMRLPSVIESAQRSPYPRLRALLAALGDAPDHVAPGGDWFFQIPNGAGRPVGLPLDEVPVPQGTPAACHRDVAPAPASAE